MSAIVEQVGGEYGATVRYAVHENGCSVEFFAAEIIGLSVPGSRPSYHQKDDTVPQISEGEESFEGAERYVEGFVKWDGCSHVAFGRESLSNQLHLCGRTEFDKLATILSEIYERCGVLMKESGSNLLEGEFVVVPRRDAT